MAAAPRIRDDKLPELLTNRHPFWGEFPWAPINRTNEPSAYGEGDWSMGGGLPHPVVPLAGQYYLEGGESDASLDATVRLRVPGRWLCRRLGWRASRAEGAFEDEGGQRVAFDPCATEAGPSALLADADALWDLLRRDELRLFWTFKARKSVYQDGPNRPEKWLGELWAEGVYVWSEAGAAGSLRFARSS